MKPANRQLQPYFLSFMGDKVLGLGFAVDGVWGLLVYFGGWGSLYKHRRVILGVKKVRWALTRLLGKMGRLGRE